jgi:hypothetical protein
MKLANYFDRVKGFGILSTADSKGRVNAAAISKPFVVDERTVAFVMPGNLTHKNLQSNPYAAYYFLEKSEKYDGVRLHLTRIRESRAMADIEEIRKKRYPIFTTKYSLESKYAVYFKVDKVLPLVAAGVLKRDVKQP